MNTINKSISVIEPVNEAIERTKTILFRPFNLEKWFIIGFCAWLAGLCQEGVHGGFNFGYNNGDFDKLQIPTKALEFCKAHIIFITLAGIAAVILLVAVMLVLLWLSSRGKFMFLDCLAKNKAHIKEPWKTFKKQANGLFGFRLLVTAAAVICMTLLGILTVWLLSFLKTGAGNAAIAGIVFFIMLLLIFTAVSVISLVQSLTIDFVVPIMYLQRIGVFTAWEKFLPLLWQNFWKIMLYLLFKILVIFCIGAIALLIIGLGCCCCCIGAVVFIPYIGTVILLPLSSFYRLYALCYFRQFGNEFDVFLSAA
jgi:hypothetical protein